MKRSIKGVFVVAALACCMQAFALKSPVTQLRSVATNILSALSRNSAGLRGSSRTKIVHKIINRYLVPAISINRMAASVLGRNVWARSSRSQKNAFIKQFKVLVINTYASAFASYNRDKIMFYPLRESYTKKQYLRVNSIILRRSGQKIPISYNVIRQGSKWYIYDFSIENVSMVRSYKSQFASILSSGGVSALVKKLKAHNSNVKK